MAEAIRRCLSRKSKNQSKGNKSLILQSSTIALLFIPPAQFKSTNPPTSALLLDSSHTKQRTSINENN